MFYVLLYKFYFYLLNVDIQSPKADFSIWCEIEVKSYFPLLDGYPINPAKLIKRTIFSWWHFSIITAINQMTICVWACFWILLCLLVNSSIHTLILDVLTNYKFKIRFNICFYESCLPLLSSCFSISSSLFYFSCTELLQTHYFLICIFIKNRFKKIILE